MTSGEPILKKGEIVNVYEDPLTETKLEGEFVLWECSRVSKFTLDGEFQLEEWQGRFYGEEMPLQRRIKVRISNGKGKAAV